MINILKMSDHELTLALLNDPEIRTSTSRHEASHLVTFVAYFKRLGRGLPAVVFMSLGHPDNPNLLGVIRSKPFVEKYWLA